MASACLFVCPRAKLRSLRQGSPVTGLATISPSTKARAGGSADLMNFYATSYAVAHGQLRFRPRLGHHAGTGYVSNNYSAISCLLRPRGAAAGHCQDTATSTTAEHFKPFWLPDGRSLLPRHVHQPGSGYHQQYSLSCLRTGAVGPQHALLLQGPPKAAREHGPESRRTGTAQPDVLQKTTVGTKEQWGFTRTTPRSDGVLPAQPLGVGIAAMDNLPSVRSHRSETLPVLPAGSERGGRFNQEVLGSPGTVGLPAVGHPVPLVSRGLQAPRATQASPLGQRGAGRKVGASMAPSPSDHAPNPPQEPLGFTQNNSQYVPPHLALSPAAPAQCSQGPTWMARSMVSIQPQHPSVFGTNSHPTGLGDAIGHPPVWPPQGGPR